MARVDPEIGKKTFDRDAALYDRARPGYPDQLFDDLFVIAGLKSDARVLEIGCGTGQATRPLARRGCRLVCVELGPNLAAVARRNLAEFPHVEVVTAAFETWDSPAANFDLVFAATSWHWLDPAVRYEKAARLLKPGGALAIVSSAHAVPADVDPFFSAIQPCYEALGAGFDDWPPPPPDEVADARPDIEGSGLFVSVRVKRYVWTIDYDAEQYIDLLNTASDHIVMEAAKRNLLFAEMRRLINARPDRQIRKHCLSILHVAQLTT
jgi:SAM-dependent methyltransferase